jgi:hypothetical protein
MTSRFSSTGQTTNRTFWCLYKQSQLDGLHFTEIGFSTRNSTRTQPCPTSTALARTINRPYYGPSPLPYPPQRRPSPPNPNSRPNYDDPDPNRVTLGPRRIRTPKPTLALAPVPAPPVTTSEDLPQLWDPPLDSLKGRTSRAYDLICTYARDCPDGTRWSPKDIAVIRDGVSYLHDDIRAMKHWQRRVAQEGDLGEETMNKIHEDAERVQKDCEHLQAWIINTERVPRGQPSVRSPARGNRASRAEAGERRDEGRGKALLSP